MMRQEKIQAHAHMLSIDYGKPPQHNAQAKMQNLDLVICIP
jgi:hypothetical protein